jgi:hypothetical protein
VAATPYYPGTAGPTSRPLTFPAGPPSSLEAGEGTATGSASVIQAHLDYHPGIPGPIPGPLSFPSGPAAFLAGAGTVTAVATETLQGTASLAGTGTLAAGGGVPVAGSAGLAGSGSITTSTTVGPPTTFVIAAVCGDIASAGTKITPAGWTVLHTVSSVNGADGSSDCVLAAACKVTAANPSVSGTSTASEDMSGQITGVIVGANSPVPAGLNPAWPYVVVEAGFGSGFQTPPDEIDWVNIQTIQNGKRLRSWDEHTGLQYELAAIEASEATALLDNPDGALTPFNAASPWYPDVVPGTPIRIRAVPPASTGVNAWLTIQRNMERWPESWDPQFRGQSEADVTDLWSVINRNLPSPYRAEVEQDQPYADWPMDDQPGPGGVTPTVLRNSAPGNTAPLTIAVSPNGTYYLLAVDEWPYMALSDVGQDSGWMYGDPAASAGPGGSGGPTTAQPGAFSWKHSGNGEGTHGFWLTCNDPSFPSLSGGVTMESWHRYDFAGSTNVLNTGTIIPGQPTGNLIIWSITTNSALIAAIYLDSSGHLQFNAGGSTTPVYAGSDLRNNTWFSLMVTMTSSSWTVWVNGGATAKVSGAASFSPNWTWLNVGASMGSSGGGSTGSVTGCGNASHSHVKVYPRVLPGSRIVSHYFAAATGFGLIPAPASPSTQYVAAGSVLPSGTFANGGYGDNAPSTMATVVTANLGSLTSGPSAEGTSVNANTAGSLTGGDYYINWSGLATSWNLYTSTQTRGEQQRTTTLNTWSDQTGGGYGSGAVPPAGPSAIGDTVAQRIERLLTAGNVTNPQRAVDQVTSLVQAALDTGGQVCGTAVTNITASDGGMLFVDNPGNLCYWGKPRLAASQVIWVLGPDVGAGQIPYLNDDAGRDTDPQRVWNDIVISPYAPDGSSLPLIKPTDSATAAASQQQYGDSQYQVTSYLQSSTSQQNQADFTLANYSSPQKRITALTVNAAGMTDSAPQAWLYVLGANVGDLVQVDVHQPGQPLSSGIYRLTKLERKVDFAAGVASLTAACDYEPGEYWT